MDFPPEIRNKVYENLLCSFGEPEENPEENSEAEENHDRAVDMDQVGRLAHTAILLASRQIYHEAKDVMLRQNQFVRVFTFDIRVPKFPGRLIVHTRHPAQDPIVKNFEGAVMSYYVKSRFQMQSTNCSCCYSSTPQDFIILGRDLDAFLQAFVGPENDLPALSTSTEHRLVLHDPFETCTNTEYDPLKVQKSLIQPFQSHFHGFTHFNIKGKVDKKLAKAAWKQIKMESLPDPGLFLEEVTYLKNNGTNAFREGKPLEAVRSWRHGIFKLQRFQCSKSWDRMRAKFDEEFFDSLAQTYFTLHSNMAQFHLGDLHMQCVGEESDMLHGELFQVEHSIRCAIEAGEVFGSSWRPSARQEAKVTFRYAQAFRLTGNLISAYLFIQKALGLQPNDPSIIREATAIRSKM